MMAETGDSTASARYSDICAEEAHVLAEYAMIHHFTRTIVPPADWLTFWDTLPRSSR